MNIQELRKYRINLEEDFLNDKSNGIALFDTIITFITAYIINYYFKLSNKLPGKNKIQTYYLLIIPFGILVHHISAHIQQQVWFPEEFTYLNKKIFSFELNIYKLLVFILIFISFNNMFSFY